MCDTYGDDESVQILGVYTPGGKKLKLRVDGRIILKLLFKK